jgi:hypothetical protein
VNVERPVSGPRFELFAEGDLLSRASMVVAELVLAARVAGDAVRDLPSVALLLIAPSTAALALTGPAVESWRLEVAR